MKKSDTSPPTPRERFIAALERHFLMQHGDATYSLPSGDRMMAFIEYIGMRLARYELILDVLRREGVYGERTGAA